MLLERNESISNDMRSYDEKIIKLMVLGERKVGKTALINKYTKSNFEGNI